MIFLKIIQRLFNLFYGQYPSKRVFIELSI